MACYVSSAVITFIAMATIVSLFALLYGIAERERWAAYSVGARLYVARWSFGVACLCLVFYLAFYILVSDASQRAMNGSLSAIACLVFYSGFFGFMTRTFTILGLGEYFSSRKF